MKKMLFVLLTLMTLVFAQSASAVQMWVMDYGPNCTTAGGWCQMSTSTNPAYLMAWEVLHEQTGLTTEASIDNMAGPLLVVFENNLRANASLGILVQRNDDGSPIATFLSAGDSSRYILFLETPATDVGLYDENEYTFYQGDLDADTLLCEAAELIANTAYVTGLGANRSVYDDILNTNADSFQNTLITWATPGGAVFAVDMYPILARSSANISGQTYIAFEVMEDFTDIYTGLGWATPAGYLPAAVPAIPAVPAPVYFTSLTGVCKPVAQFFRWEGWPASTVTELFQVSSAVNNMFEYVGPGEMDEVDAEGPTFHKEKGDPCFDNSTINLAFNTPGENTGYMVFAKFVKQFQYDANASAITAELDTDMDFKQFVVGSGTNVLTTTIGMNNLNELFSLDQLNASTMGFIAFAPTLSTSVATVTIHSAAPEPGVTININNATTNCTTSNNTDFVCANVPLNEGAMGIDVTVNTTSQRIPTAWNITDIDITSSIITDLCDIGSRPIGIWSGGLEVFVPFVKCEYPDGLDATAKAETYIRLYNRYNKDAKVFLSTFKDTYNAITNQDVMVGLYQLPATGNKFGEDLSKIPADGNITIACADIDKWLSDKFGITWDETKGIPVKFQVLVPQQRYEGETAVIGTLSEDDQYGLATATGSGTVTADLIANPMDPYVHGAVMSVYNYGAASRSIPLMFKQFKNGGYIE